MCFYLPALIPLLLFWIGPVFYSAGLSFTDWDMISAQINFIGMDNYKSLLGDPEFYRTLKNTLFFSIGNIIPTILFGVLIALALCIVKRGGFFKIDFIFSVHYADGGGKYCVVLDF